MLKKEHYKLKTGKSLKGVARGKGCIVTQYGQTHRQRKTYLSRSKKSGIVHMNGKILIGRRELNNKRASLLLRVAKFKVSTLAPH